MLEYLKHTENNIINTHITTIHRFNIYEHFAPKFVLKRKKIFLTVEITFPYHSPSPFPDISKYPEIGILPFFLTFTCLLHLHP